MARYGKVKTLMGGTSPEILGALQKVMMIRKGMLASGQDDQDCSTSTARDVTSERIPDDLWTRTA
eukprot:CAMPEP_0185795688 /NCGR_PEP_ID=MMETSP1174-20130828/160676_1 /TAXON_ID=35687 /ORGANISM="Dictyocha speculum, Strain CCMP1381" /LENGTH=64 /DNA_ID=CAMNT_0028490991 /DNA_START=1120 /DNA_END=1314 /DNA_ORIENTATION=-